MNKNIFIALEGIDGSGKSTQARLLVESLRAVGRNVYPTFEPTPGPVGRMIRSVLKGEMKMDNRVIAALFAADRLDHLVNEENGLLSKFASGCDIVSDRYYFSSYAYHSAHMDMDWVIDSNRLSAEMMMPKATIFIDVPPEVCMERIVAAREKIELYETLGQLKVIRSKYFEAFKRLGGIESVHIIDGNRSQDRVAQDVFAYVQTLL